MNIDQATPEQKAQLLAAAERIQQMRLAFGVSDLAGVHLGEVLGHLIIDNNLDPESMKKLCVALIDELAAIRPWAQAVGQRHLKLV